MTPIDPLRLHDPAVLEQLRREDVGGRSLLVAAYVTVLVGTVVGFAGAVVASSTTVMWGAAIASVLAIPLFLLLVWRSQRRLRQLRAAVVRRVGLPGRGWRGDAVRIALPAAVGIALAVVFNPGVGLLAAGLGAVGTHRASDPALPRWVTAVELTWLSAGAALFVGAVMVEADRTAYFGPLGMVLTMPTGLPALLLRDPVLRASAAGSTVAGRLVPLLPPVDRVRAIREGGDPARALQRAFGCLAAGLPNAAMVREAGLAALAAGDRDTGSALLGGAAWAAPGDSDTLIALARALADDDPTRALGYARLAESVSGRRLRGAPEARALREQLELGPLAR